MWGESGLLTHCHIVQAAVTLFILSAKGPFVCKLFISEKPVTRISFSEDCFHFSIFFSCRNDIQYSLEFFSFLYILWCRKKGILCLFVTKNYEFHSKIGMVLHGDYISTVIQTYKTIVYYANLHMYFLVLTSRCTCTIWC